MNPVIIAAVEAVIQICAEPIQPFAEEDEVIEGSDYDDDDDDDSDDEDAAGVLEDNAVAAVGDPEIHIRISSHVHDVVHLYSDADFRAHFRLSRTGVEKLYLELRETIIQVEGKCPVSMIDALLLSLWILATPESFRSVADRFNFARGHAHSLCLKVWHIMYDKSYLWIQWPRGAAAVRCIQDFLQRGNIPDVIGVVDGCHIEIPGPARDNSYYNRKGYHSVLLQAVCDSHLRFIDVFCGFPGSSHDARVWSNSPLGIALAENRDDHLPPGSHILCDSAYPCTTYTIPVFKDNGHLTPQQIAFNKEISSVRVRIELAFGRLKGIFRRLLYLHVTNLNYPKYYIIAACILHNMVIEERFELGDLNFEPVHEGDEMDWDEPDLADNVDDEVAIETGAQKRVALMNTVIPL